MKQEYTPVELATYNIFLSSMLVLPTCAKKNPQKSQNIIALTKEMQLLVLKATSNSGKVSLVSQCLISMT